jgi:hypothetical protein
MKNNLTRKQFYQNEQERGGHLDQPGVRFTSIPADSEQRELPSKPPTEFSTVREYDFGWDYEIELKNYNRLIGNGIHNMNEINQNLINMKQRGDTFEITGFTCTIGTSSIEVTFSGDNKKDDIRLYVGFYAILSDTNGQQMSFKISSASLTEISISGIQTDATFNSSDSSYTVSINKDNLFIPLIAVTSGSIAAGDNKLDYTSDNAFIEFGVDLTSYHGNHKIVITDSAGKSASGYLHSVAPGGETLGASVILNGDFSGTWTGGLPQSHILTGTITGTSYLEADDVNDRLRIVSDGAVMGVRQAVFTVGGMHKITVNVQTVNSGTIKTQFSSDASKIIISGTGGTTGYRNAEAEYCQFIRNEACDVIVNSWAAEPLTDCAATGALIVSTLGGATRSWTSVDTGFNPNLACTYAIYRVR